MKLLILKENLKKGLDIVERIVSKNLTLPILNNILLDGKKNTLKISATDLEIGINFWLLAKIEKEGQITIPGKFLSNIINYLPSDKISLEEKNQNLFIEHKDYSAQIKGTSSQDFPIIPSIEKNNFIIINSALFSKGLLYVVENSSITQTRPEISGVFIVFDKNLIILVATDSFRLSEKKIVSQFKTSSLFKPVSLILPQKTARELINIISDKEQDLYVYFSPNQIMFELRGKESNQPQVQVISRLIEGEYPNYQEIIPKQYKTEIHLKKNEFLNQIKLASLFSDKINEVKIVVGPKKNGLDIFAQSSDFGQTQSFINGEVKGERTEVSFNWKFLVDGLNNIKSQEIVFGLNKEDGPATLKPVGDETYTYVVMPIKGS